MDSRQDKVLDEYIDKKLADNIELDFIKDQAAARINNILLEMQKMYRAKNFLSKFYRIFNKKYPYYNEFDYTLYAIWNNMKGVWQEKPDFMLKFKGYDRKSILFKPTDPDRSLAIEITNMILETMTMICENQDITRIDISCITVEPNSYKTVIDISNHL